MGQYITAKDNPRDDRRGLLDLPFVTLLREIKQVRSNTSRGFDAVGQQGRQSVGRFGAPIHMKHFHGVSLECVSHLIRSK